MPKKQKKEIKPHPEALDKTAKVKKPIDVKVEFVSGLLKNVETDLQDRESRDLKLLRWYKKRYGIRPSKKNFPFPGASNTHIALTDEKIRKLKPNFTNLAIEGDPVVTFMPVGNTPLSAARNVSLFMHWLLMYYMRLARGHSFFRNLALIIDRMLERGKGYAKVVWDYDFVERTRIIDLEKIPDVIKEQIYNPLVTDEELEMVLIRETTLNPADADDKKEMRNVIEQFKRGEQILKFRERRDLYNGPRVVAIDDKDLILPRYTTDIQSVDRICHILHYSENDLKKEEESGKFENVGAVIENRKKGTGRRPGSDIIRISPMQTLESLKKSREGIGEYETTTELIDIYEIYTYYDVNGDDIEEKVVIDVDPKTQQILRFIEYPYEHEKWPFIIFDYEFNDDRFYSQRGLPECLDPYQTIATNQENAKLDRMTLANSFQFKYKIGSVNTSNIRFIPSQGIGVKRMEDLEAFQIPNIDFSYDKEMEKIRGLAESYIGQPDFDLGSFSKGKERRTAFEVSEMVNLGKQLFSFDSMLFKDSLFELYDQIFELWMQYGPDDVYVAVTGQEQPLHLTKQQLRGNFVIVPSGEITLLARTLAEQKAFALLELATKDQSGAIDQYNAWENYLIKFAPRESKRMLRDRQQFEAIQNMRIQMEREEHEKKLEVAGRKSAQSQPPGGIRLGETGSGSFGGNLMTPGGGRQV